jgi:hypothetical protein
MSLGEFFRITDVCVFLVCNFFLGKPVFVYNCFIVMALAYVWQLRTQPKHAAYIDVTNSTNEKPLFPLTYDTQVLQSCGQLRITRPPPRYLASVRSSPLCRLYQSSPNWHMFFFFPSTFSPFSALPLAQYLRMH